MARVNVPVPAKVSVVAADDPINHHGPVHNTVERQELHCHACDRYVQFDLDLGLNGRHVLRCPSCGHEHCRIVKDGVITDERWAQRNDDTTTTIYVSAHTATWTTTSTFSNAGSTSTYYSDLWLQTTSAR